ncbi:MAG: IscS subfamily cysteine desulfurase [Christensenellaceae bacterium]|nr:IscS subfamily cysteine desulfurase [Christensenellaceae bacterium]
MKKSVYLDNAATTYVAGEVLQAMLPYFTTEFGNASSVHSFGRSAEKALATAREQIAKTINARPEEIYFTSGATESNNWILRSAIQNHPSKRIIISATEHPSILDTCDMLAKQGYKIDYVKVDRDGVINVADLISKLARPAAIVSIMTANNEVGTIQYLNTIANLCHERGVLFHTDATQAISRVFIDVNEMKIDALSMSAHKIYGPKGIGALYIKSGVKVNKFIRGGHQERNLRAGTVNVPGVVGFGVAAAIAMRDSTINNSRIKSLRDYMINQIETRIPDVHLNGHRHQRLANNVNFSFRGVEGESLLTLLDFAGIAASTGSACTSATLGRSHVLTAMGVMDELINGSIRFSLGRATTKADIDYVVGELEKSVKKLRSISAI